MVVRVCKKSVAGGSRPAAFPLLSCAVADGRGTATTFKTFLIARQTVLAHGYTALAGCDGSEQIVRLADWGFLASEESGQVSRGTFLTMRESAWKADTQGTDNDWSG